MLKPALLTLAGLAASVSAASADTIVPTLPRPDLSALSAPSVDLCSRYGVSCAVPGVRYYGWGGVTVPRSHALPLHVPGVPHVTGGYGWGHGQLADISALMEDVQERLDRRPVAPFYNVPLTRLSPRGSLGGVYNPILRAPAVRSIRPNHLPGNSIVILPRW